MLYSCTLPFPPSVNALFGGGSNQRRFMSKAYKEWIKSCPQLVLPECGAINFPVSVSYTFFMPDKRARDLTNYTKAPEDYLVSQWILFDDNHSIVQRVVLELGGLDKGNPRVEIQIFKNPSSSP